MGVRCIRQFTELPAKDALLELTHGLLYPRKNEVYIDIVSICIIFVSTAFSNSACSFAVRFSNMGHLNSSSRTGGDRN